MACAPKCSYYRRPRQLLVLANDCRNGDDVISLGGMLKSVDKTEPE